MLLLIVPLYYIHSRDAIIRFSARRFQLRGCVCLCWTPVLSELVLLVPTYGGKNYYPIFRKRSLSVEGMLLLIVPLYYFYSRDASIRFSALWALYMLASNEFWQMTGSVCTHTACIQEPTVYNSTTTVSFILGERSLASAVFILVSATYLIFLHSYCSTSIFGKSSHEAGPMWKQV